MSTLTLFLLLICMVSANAFVKAYNRAIDSKALKSFKVTMSSLRTPSEYNSKEAEIFSNDIKNILSLGPIPMKERQFLINGWRWHTISALRDLQRYSAVIEKIEAQYDMNILKNTRDDFKTRINLCYNYVCDYNLKALMKIETDLFFPWLQRLLPSQSKSLMIEVIQEQADVRAKSIQIGSLCRSLTGDMTDIQSIRKISTKIKEMRISYLKIQNVQETVFVPYITAFIPKKEQERFNRGVIANLGFIRAQVHLVGMIEALKDQPEQMTLLRSQIPSIAQATLPLWKSRIYDGKTACLEFK